MALVSLVLVRMNLLAASIPKTDVHEQGHNVNFIGTLPQGYAAFNNTTPAGHTMVELWGHPHGYAFTFVRDFSVHVISIMTASLVGCRCTLCVVPCPSSEGSSASLSEGCDSTPYSFFPITPPATDDSVSVQVVESDQSTSKKCKKWTTQEAWGKAKFHKKCKWFIRLFAHRRSYDRFIVQQHSITVCEKCY